MITIYTLKDPISNEIRYVGKTRLPLKYRYYTHIAPRNLDLNTYKSNWIKSLRSRNLLPIIETLDIVPENEWVFWEQYWICQCKAWGFRLTNLTNGGEGGPSNRKDKLGKKHSQESKNKIALANSKPKSKEWILAASSANFKEIIQYDLDNNKLKEWKSATIAAIELGDISKKKNISACCIGKRKSAYNYKWKFKNTESKDKEL